MKVLDFEITKGEDKYIYNIEEEGEDGEKYQIVMEYDINKNEWKLDYIFKEAPIDYEDRLAHWLEYVKKETIRQSKEIPYNLIDPEIISTVINDQGKPVAFVEFEVTATGENGEEETYNVHVEVDLTTEPPGVKIYIFKKREKLPTKYPAEETIEIECD